MLQYPRERALVAVEDAREGALAAREQPPFAGFLPRPQQSRAHHRRGRQRKHERDEDCHRERDGEFAEVTADDAAHKQDRDEYGNERQAHRKHRESDLAGTEQRRLFRFHSGLDMARSVLQHDDRVVDDDTDREHETEQ